MQLGFAAIDLAKPLAKVRGQLAYLKLELFAARGDDSRTARELSALAAIQFRTGNVERALATIESALPLYASTTRAAALASHGPRDTDLFSIREFWTGISPASYQANTLDCSRFRLSPTVS